MIERWILQILLVAVTTTSAFGQQSSRPSGESHKYRTIVTLAGGGGGFAAGLFAGLAVFDDATNSDRKVWTTDYPCWYRCRARGLLSWRHNPTFAGRDAMTTTKVTHFAIDGGEIPSLNLNDLIATQNVNNVSIKWELQPISRPRVPVLQRGMKRLLSE